MTNDLWAVVCAAAWVFGYAVLMHLSAKRVLVWPWSNPDLRGYEAYRSAERTSLFLFFWMLTLPSYGIYTLFRKKGG